MQILLLALVIAQLIGLAILFFVVLRRGHTEVDLDHSLRQEGRAARDESAQLARQQREELANQLQRVTEVMEKRLEAVRGTVENQLKALQTGNEAKLEQMRKTVDEQLQGTLQKRLGESFALVSQRLEAVQRGLGEMQNLAADVGGLKRVLTGVKTRGMFGEVQLGALLDQLLTAEQYASNVATIPGSTERVEFVIRLPGPTRDGQVWLPIDAKFPREDYERLLDAQEQANVEAANAAGAALERRIIAEARTIREKYVAPPHTTDFAILYLPTEGLYAEVLRRPGLFESVQRDHHVTLAGPTTLTAVLNSLQMGFRTLAIEQRSSEVWQLLAAVKTEFNKFGAVLDKVKKQLDTARGTLEQTGVRTRAMARTLKAVESISTDASADALELPQDARSETDQSV